MVVISQRGARASLRESSVGAHPLEGRRVATADGRLVYDLSEGTFADGRFTVWSTKGGLQGEVTIYGSGRPIVRSERGTLGHSR